MNNSLTFEQVNAALKKAGIDATINRYGHIVYTDGEIVPSGFTLRQLSIDQWIEKAKSSHKPAHVEGKTPLAASRLSIKHTRGCLNEGRSQQMGFAFCKKVGEKYETVQPISPCKDYLNDVVWAEGTNKSIAAYGLKYKPTGLFKEGTAYVAFSNCTGRGDCKYPGYDKDVARLKENALNITKLLNAVEDKMQVERSEIEQVGENLYMATISAFWCKYTYLISLWSLLVRMGQYYDGKKEPLDFINSFNQGDDVYTFNSAKAKFHKILERNIPVQDLESIGGGTYAHNAGIVSVNLTF